MKELSNALGGRATPVVKVGASPEAKTDKPSMELAKATTPKPTVETAPVEDVAKKPAGEMEKKSAAPADESGFANSLGMKFVPLPGSDGQIAIWPTRVRDFEAFAKSANLKSGSWKDPGFKQGPDHPVVNVSWQDAMAFCKWLTSKEQKEGLISPKQSYRLPTDLEWSHAAGLANETGSTPESRDMGVSDVYPWGGTWPPPAGAGNYTGEETGSDVAIKGYNDGFPWTSPVGSFPPNKFGLYDMGGNVWQWCMDSWNAESKAKVLRGASWYNGALKLSLLTSCRVHASPDSSTDNYGFRIVLAGDSGKASKK
jgi:formylglycine-generating enzyme required for sulfatase activity